MKYKCTRPFLSERLCIKFSGADLAIVRPLIHITAPTSQRSSIPQGDRVPRWEGDGWMKGGGRGGEESKTLAGGIKEERLDSAPEGAPINQGLFLGLGGERWPGTGSVVMTSSHSVLGIIGFWHYFLSTLSPLIPTPRFLSAQQTQQHSRLDAISNTYKCLRIPQTEP